MDFFKVVGKDIQEISWPGPNYEYIASTMNMFLRMEATPEGDNWVIEYEAGTKREVARHNAKFLQTIKWKY